MFISQVLSVRFSLFEQCGAGHLATGTGQNRSTTSIRKGNGQSEFDRNRSRFAKVGQVAGCSDQIARHPSGSGHMDNVDRTVLDVDSDCGPLDVAEGRFDPGPIEPVAVGVYWLVYIFKI